MLLISGLHFEMRTVFFLAVIPGLFGVVLILFGVREHRAGAVSAHEASTGPLTRPFWRVMAAIALFALANSSDAFLILQAHAAGEIECTVLRAGDDSGRQWVFGVALGRGDQR